MDLFELEATPTAQAQMSLRLLVHFKTPANRRAFSLRVGQLVTSDTTSISWPVPNKMPLDFLRVEQIDEAQNDLLDVDENWQDVWKGMPAYVQRDMESCQKIAVYFATRADRMAFAELVEHPVSDETKSIWFPRAELDKVNGLRWRSTRPMNPQYPVYVPTKGRWDSAFTIKMLERLKVPYYAVVQPQELPHYEPVIETGRVLVLPEGLDGLVPTRNWIYEHAIGLGAERHWQLDDNIKDFYRYHENRQIRTADATCMRIAEDFVDRYENMAIAGFQYFMFIPRKNGLVPPYVFNTRVYSNSLINNRMPFRYRDVYNDDTDICLRALKAGWCTVQFNAFNAYKMPTMQVKGGNTPIYLGAAAVQAEWESHAASCPQCEVDVSPTCEAGRAILQRDGRWRMAESLFRQHPDVTTIMRRWNRWQHWVDYRRFKKNAPILRPGVVLPEGLDEYGLELVEVEQPVREPRPAKVKTVREPKVKTKEPKPAKVKADVAKPEPAPAPAPAPVSVLAFLQQLGNDGAIESQPVPEPVATPEQLLPAPTPTPVTPAVAQPDVASSLKAALLQRGHRLLLKDGKFLVSEASRLTDEDRAAIKANREALIALAETWQPEPPPEPPPSVKPEPSEYRYEWDGSTLTLDHVKPEPAAQDGIFTTPIIVQSTADFLGAMPSARAESAWSPSEPPSLTGIDAIVLNFATTGLDWRGGDRPVGVTVSTLDGQLTRFLPFAFRAGRNLDEDAVRRWMQAEVRGKQIVNSNTKFDVHHAREWGVDLEAQGCTFADVGHDAALLDDHRKRFGIDYLEKDYLGGEEVARVDESMHADYDPADVAERELYTARLVGRLRAVFDPLIAEQDLGRVRALEEAVIPAVVEMEKNGSPIDVALMEQMRRDCENERGRLLLEVSRECGFAFEHNATGWKRLFEKLGLPPSDSYNEAVISKIDHPLVRMGYKASEYASLNSRIFKGYLPHIRDGVLYYGINQVASDDGGTVSGRFSIGQVQQVNNHDNHHQAFSDPATLEQCHGDCELFPRRLFIPGAGDYLEGDAAQIEFRLLVHYSQNPRLLQAYRDDPKMSFHKAMQAELKKYKPDMLYSHTKSYNFAAQYGAKSIKLATMMKFITEDVAKEIRASKRWDDPRLALIKQIEAAYQQAHPEATELLERAAHLAKPKCDEFCRKGDKLHQLYEHRGYVKDMLGRRSRFPNGHKTYIGLNRILQGSGAEWMKQKLVELHAERRQTGFTLRITNHDAILGDATQPDTLAKVSQILNRQSFPLKVPILAEVGTGRDWAHAK